MLGFLYFKGLQSFFMCWSIHNSLWCLDIWTGFLACDAESDFTEKAAIFHVCKTTEMHNNMIITKLILKHNYEMATMYLTQENQ